MYPGSSPAKKGFPLEHSPNAPSSICSAASAPVVAAAFSSSVVPMSDLIHAAKNCAHIHWGK
jgi:hypothetical protein